MFNLSAILSSMRKPAVSIVLRGLFLTVAGNVLAQTDIPPVLSSPPYGLWRSVQSTTYLRNGFSHANMNCDVEIDKHIWVSTCLVREKAYSITSKYQCGEPSNGRFPCYAEVIADTSPQSHIGTKTRMNYEIENGKLVVSAYPLLSTSESLNLPASVVSVLVRK